MELGVEVADKRRRRSWFVRKASTTPPPIAEVCLEDQYKMLKSIGSGHFSKTALVEDKLADKRVALKQFKRCSCNKSDLFREYNYSYFLSPHPNVIDTYEGVSMTADIYFFVQEYSPNGSLRDAVEKTGRGLPEDDVKRVIDQLSSALEFMHAEGLVHRNIRAKNVLLFDDQFNRIKITDMALTRRKDTLVKHFSVVNPYHAPELCECLIKESYAVDQSIDIWAFAILIYYCLKARYPWQKATIMSKPYWEWEEWLKGKRPQLPHRWTKFSERLLKFFRKSLRPQPLDRCKVKDIHKYIRARWMKESKSMSDDDLYLLPEPRSSRDLKNPSPSTSLRISPSVDGLEDNDGNSRRSTRSVLHSWLASTITTMAEISEQVVSARE